MPTNIKCLLKFRDNTGNGWTETHYRLSSSLTPNLAAHLTNLVDVIVPLRAPLLAEDCQVIGARVSYPRADAIASLPKKFFIGGSADHIGVSADLSLACQFIDATSTKSKILHMRGFWDAVESNGEYHPDQPFAAGWLDRLNAWKQGLIDGQYGWLAKDPALSAKGVVSTYLSDATGHVTFTLEAPGMPLATVNTTQSVRFSKINKSNSPLNRQLLVFVVDQTHVVTVAQVGAGPFTAKGRFNFRGTSFVQYSALQNVSLGRRAQGRPLDRAPGRSRVQPLY